MFDVAANWKQVRLDENDLLIIHNYSSFPLLRSTTPSCFSAEHIPAVAGVWAPRPTAQPGCMCVYLCIHGRSGNSRTTSQCIKALIARMIRQCNGSVAFGRVNVDSCYEILPYEVTLPIATCLSCLSIPSDHAIFKLADSDIVLAIGVAHLLV